MAYVGPAWPTTAHHGVAHAEFVRRRPHRRRPTSDGAFEAVPVPVFTVTGFPAILPLPATVFEGASPGPPPGGYTRGCELDEAAKASRSSEPGTARACTITNTTQRTFVVHKDFVPT